MDSYDRNEYICKICRERVLKKNHFWRAHRVSEAEYFVKYERKKDLLTGEIIPFKNYESYIQTDFITRGNLRKFLEKQK